MRTPDAKRLANEEGCGRAAARGAPARGRYCVFIREEPDSLVDGPVEMDGEVLHGLPSHSPRPIKFKVRLDSGSETIAFTRGRRLLRRKLISGDRVRVRLAPNSSRGLIVRRLT